MKALDTITLIIIIIGGIVWGLFGLFSWNLITAIFGDASVITRIIYIIVGLSALWQIMPLSRSMSSS
jgi:uncharacterized membrane protein YuzA (DUF378 family)